MIIEVRVVAPRGVSVKCGIYTYKEEKALIGKKVSEARAIHAIPTNHVAYKGKLPLSDSHVLEPGDHIEFYHR